MKTTYIYHSCFLVETKLCYYLFDYYRGDLPKLDTDKPILVFSSHSHSDIFSKLRELGMTQIYGVLSDDIDVKTIPAYISYLSAAPSKEYELPWGQHLTTFPSTDEGVAFLIEETLVCPVEEGKELFYHAGDLNDWVWEGETASYNEKLTRDYRRQIDILAAKTKGRKLSCAFVVLDPRQENDYDRGMLYFLGKVDSNMVYPMHYWEKPQIIRSFVEAHPQYAKKIVFTER